MSPFRQLSKCVCLFNKYTSIHKCLSGKGTLYDERITSARTGVVGYVMRLFCTNMSQQADCCINNAGMSRHTTLDSTQH